MLGSSYPACFPPGSRGSDAQEGVARKVLASFVRWPVPDGGAGAAAVRQCRVGDRADHGEPRRCQAVRDAERGEHGGGRQGGASGGETVLGMLYVEVPATAPGIGGVTVSPNLVRTGLVLLVAAFPVGLAFGLLSTRRLTRRLGRLAALTQQVGDGDFGLRVPVRGHDEVSRLEENFNRMAGQLQASLDATRGSARPTPGTRSAPASPASCTTPSPRSCSRSACWPAGCAGRCPRSPRCCPRWRSWSGPRATRCARCGRCCSRCARSRSRRPTCRRPGRRLPGLPRAARHPGPRRGSTWPDSRPTGCRPRSSTRCSG